MNTFFHGPEHNKGGLDPVNYVAQEDDYFIVKKLDEVVPASTALQNDDDLYFHMLAYETWGIDLFLEVVDSGTAGGIKLGFTGPASADNTYLTCDIYASTSTAATANTANGSGNHLATFGLTNFAGPVAVGAARVCGFFKNGANAGNFQLQWAQNAAAGTTTISRGSWLHARRLG